MAKLPGQGSCTGSSCPGSGDTDAILIVEFSHKEYTNNKNVTIPVIKKVNEKTGTVQSHSHELSKTKVPVLFDLIIVPLGNGMNYYAAANVEKE